MCCSETSASVQWVATRIVWTPQSLAIRRWSTVPMPGSNSAEILAFFMCGITALQVLLVAVRRKSVVDRRAAEPVTVGHFDQRHARLIERRRDSDHLLDD